jgi:cobalt-zinc-cadmium efflux system membrane fusion protein
LSYAQYSIVRRHERHFITALICCIAVSAGAWAVAPPKDHGHAHSHEGAKPEGDKHDEKGHDEKGHVDEVTLTPEAIRRYGIRVEPVTKRVLAPTFVAPARVAFNAEAVAHVGSAVRGRAVELKAKVGQTVKAGDELLIIESPELGEAQSDFLQKQTAAAVAATAVEPAKQAFERAKKLHEENQGISLAELQKREADLKAAQGAVMTQKAAAAAAHDKLLLLGMDAGEVKQLEEGGKLMPRHVVRAPIFGQVIEREVTQGELVSSEKEALLVLANMETLWVLADVAEAKLGRITVGSEARVTFPALPGKSFRGKVAHIAAALDANTRTANVRIELPNENAALHPGMFAKAELSAANGGEAAEPVLAIPDEAIQTVEGGPAVFVPVEGEENTFAKRAVTVGEAVGGFVPILSGLKEGERIVTAGTFILKAELGKSGAAHEH